VWIYPTFSEPGERVFYAFESQDLANWTRHGPVLDFKNVTWLDDDGAKHHWPWAPCAVEKGGKYYFYYSVGPQVPTPSRIGVAVGESPAGPFIDSGRPLLTGENDRFEAIDPMVFTDKDGTSYLYAGGSNGARLKIFELNEDMTSLRREIPVENPPQFTEGAFLHERQGIYYLSYSHGWWQGDTYSVHYATGPTPAGPFTYRGPILVGNDRHKGPGHHSIIHDSKTDTWRIVYHRWNNQTGAPPYQGLRSTAIDLLTYDENGLINPVVMTD
jgi:beta-xylosidase